LPPINRWVVRFSRLSEAEVDWNGGDEQTNPHKNIKTGLLSRRTFELLLSKVESIGVEEGILGRLFGYGSVVVRGTGGTPEPFKTVSHPLEFRRQVQQQIEQREQGNQVARVSPENLLV
jgi:uncharacterized membrane protein YdbT with pleckstrin-like domain